MADQEVRDWQAGRTIADCNKYMLQHHLLCDVTFRVGDNTEDIPAHKYVLISRSPVFYAMFCGLMAPTDNAVIELPDVDPQAFKEMLKYLYYEEAHINFAEHGLLILYCAKKYIIPGLVDICTSALIYHITPNNVCFMLEQCMDLDENILVKHCLKYISTEARRIFQRRDHINISRQALKTIVQPNELYAKETEVYSACIQWAKARCGSEATPQQLRDVLGDIVYDVRIPTMNQEEFASCIQECDLFSRDELKDLFLYIARKDVNIVNFHTVPRILKFRTIRFSGVSRSDWPPGYDSINIKCSSNMLLTDVVVFGSPDPRAVHRVTAEVYDDSLLLACRGGRIIRSVSESHKKGHRVKLMHRCELDRNVTYTIRVHMENIGPGPGHTYAGNGGMRRMAYIGGTITYSNPVTPRWRSSTTVAAGQIPRVVLLPIT